MAKEKDNLNSHRSLKSWNEIRIARKDPKSSPQWFNKLQDLLHRSNYTQSYIADWCEEQHEVIQQQEADLATLIDHESYTSEVEGVTEDEGEVRITPRQRPIEAPEDLERRETTFVQTELLKFTDLSAEQIQEKKEEAQTEFLRKEYLSLRTWEANERCRQLHLEKYANEKRRHDKKRQGPLWQASIRNQERTRLKAEATKRRA
ncbi:hypothetical protein BGX27_001381, partial [Mortierella sp. AM989]